uniref:Retrotransposon gag domain-containing protein n=1 Tax=Tanacetum cinerariifolium TaxID=118510 RepID=A0A699H4W3_TANCI|nr:hypothetical protein [Tanacetum cinerariifolium]
MVATQTNAIEPQLYETVKNRVTTQLNEKFDQLNNMMNEFVCTQQYLVTDVTRLKNGEGEADSVDWFFAVDDVRKEDKIKIVSIHIYDRALAWHLQFVRTQGGNVSWPMYEEAILKRFGEVNQDPMAELKNLRYKTTMKQYQSDFETLLNQVEITESQYVSKEVESPNANGELLLSECYASLQISLNAISGLRTYNTMRMKAMVTKHLLYLLMDTSSTHNFLDLFTAKKLGCKLTKTYPLQVTVARGNKMEFVIETYASGYGIDAVLQQRGHLTAFLSKTLALKHQSLSASDALSRIQKNGELFTILTALPSNEFMEAISAMWTTDPVLSGNVKNLQDGSLVTSNATNTTPFEVVYGYPPPLHIPYMSKDSKVELMDRTLTAREKTIDLLKINLEKA